MCNFSEKTVSLGQYINFVPAPNFIRAKAELDLTPLRTGSRALSHIVVKMPVTNKMDCILSNDFLWFLNKEIFSATFQVQLNADFYTPTERFFNVKAPNWFTLKKLNLIAETMQGTLHYKISFIGMEQ